MQRTCTRSVLACVFHVLSVVVYVQLDDRIPGLVTVLSGLVPRPIDRG